MAQKHELSYQKWSRLKHFTRGGLRFIAGSVVAYAALHWDHALGADVISAPTNCAATACFFVRAGASGTGSDWNNALGSLPSSLVRGATYFLADGSYGSYTFDDANSGTTAITIKKAVESDHGTNTGWLSSYGDGQAAFTHWSIITDHYVFDGKVRNSDWFRGTFSQYGIKVAGTWPVRLDNGMGAGADNVTFKFIDFQAGGRDTGDGDDVIYGLTGNSNLTFQYCALHDSDRTIFTMRGEWKNLVVDHSYIARNTSTAATHGEMMSMTDVTNMTFSYNMIEDIEGTAVWAGINGGVETGLKMYGNVIMHSAAYAADTGRKAGHSFGVSGTVFIANDSSNNNSAYNMEFYNNTLYNTQGLWSGVIVQLGSNNKVFNNIYYNSVRTNNSGVDVQGNWYYNTIADGDWSTDKQVCTSGCSIFVNAADHNFHLTAATNAGLPLASPFNIDGDGISRGSDGRWDRGAFEFGGTVTSPTPTPVPTATPMPTATPVPTASPVPTATPAPTSTPAIIGETLLGSSAPGIVDANDGVSYELGMKFSATTAGQITAIRFYKSPSETGSHTGKIYSSTGALLASVTFANESASGWQIAYLATPLVVSANATYTVSVNTAGNYYVSTVGDFATAKASQNLRAPIGAGVYGAVGAKPTSSWNNSNYFRDVVFVASSTATPTPVPTATPVSSDTVKPSVAITSPVSGSRVARNSPVTIAATASDNVAVTKVEFYVNGVLKCTDTFAPFTCIWSVPRGRNIPYQLQAIASDAAGNKATSASVDVTAR